MDMPKFFSVLVGIFRSCDSEVYTELYFDLQLRTCPEATKPGIVIVK